MEEKRRRSDKIFDRLGYLEGLTVGMRQDIKTIKKAVDKTIPASLMIKIITVFFVAVFSWLGILTAGIMGN